MRSLQSIIDRLEKGIKIDKVVQKIKCRQPLTDEDWEYMEAQDGIYMQEQSRVAQGMKMNEDWNKDFSTVLKKNGISSVQYPCNSQGTGFHPPVEESKAVDRRYLLKLGVMVSALLYACPLIYTLAMRR